MLVISRGPCSIASPTGMLNAGKVPTGEILDGKTWGANSPADTSGTCSRLGDQENGVVLCEGGVGNVLVGVAFLAQVSRGRQQRTRR